MYTLGYSGLGLRYKVMDLDGRVRFYYSGDARGGFFGGIKDIRVLVIGLSGYLGGLSNSFILKLQRISLVYLHVHCRGYIINSTGRNT